MKLSIFTTATRPIQRGDLYAQALKCYTDLADEVIVINGGGAAPMDEVTMIDSPWPQEFDFRLIGEQFQRGYEACTGDWVIHADLDFLFHELDYRGLRQVLQQHDNYPALSFWKYQFILPDRYNLKSRLVIAVNKKKYGDRIKFNSGGDLCQPSLDGKEISQESVPEARIPFFNYEKILKTKVQVVDDVGRMARAYKQTFGNYGLGGPDDQSATNEWIKLMHGRFMGRSHEIVSLSFHPEVMRQTIYDLTPEQFGYDGWGMFSKNTYATMKERGVS